MACGGIAEKSPVLMQLLADITGRPVHVPASSRSPRAGRRCSAPSPPAQWLHSDGFDDIGAAVTRLRPKIARSYEPDPAATETYARVYEIYRGLHDALGSEHVEWMHALKDALRREAGLRRPKLPCGGAAEPAPMRNAFPRIRLRRDGDAVGRG